MSEREARIARNEAVAREINEGIEDARPTSAAEYVRMVCECGRPDCSSVIAIANDQLETAAGPSGPDPDALIRPQCGMPDAVRHEFRDQQSSVVPDVGRQPQRVERSAYLSQRTQVGRDAQLQPPGRPIR